MAENRNALPGDDDELSVDELEQAAGGAADALADNTNCGSGNCNCGGGTAPEEPIIWT